MKEKTAILIISDLDGTLLDHNNYQFEAALPALNVVKSREIPLILNSSKTAAEIKVIRSTLDNHYPFVVENGAGIYLPSISGKDEVVSFGKKRSEIITILHEIKEKLSLSYIGFDDMSLDDLMLCTGLNKEQAEMAKQRDFTEPLQWHDNDNKWQLFCQELKKAGLSYAKGGRFISVSINVDKGQSINWLRNYYKKEFNLDPIIIALGDSENDKQMLENADYPVLVKSPAHDFPELEIDNLTYTKEYGPAGWNESVTYLLNKLL